jgi:hypothetical protein
MASSHLDAVVYRLFESELNVVSAVRAGMDHIIDAEIEFRFEDGSKKFVSWASDPEQYCLAIFPQTFFSPDALVEVDVTDHPHWRVMRGERIEFLMLDREHQCIEVRSTRGSAFLASTENGHWWADVVAVSSSQPLGST